MMKMNILNYEDARNRRKWLNRFHSDWKHLKFRYFNKRIWWINKLELIFLTLLLWCVCFILRSSCLLAINLCWSMPYVLYHLQSSFNILENLYFSTAKKVHCKFNDIFHSFHIDCIAVQCRPENHRKKIANKKIKASFVWNRQTSCIHISVWHATTHPTVLNMKNIPISINELALASVFRYLPVCVWIRNSNDQKFIWLYTFICILTYLLRTFSSIHFIALAYEILYNI